MDDTGLDLGLGKGRFYGLGKALEAIHDRDEDVLNAAIAQVVQNLGPELGTLVRLEPKAQHVTCSVWQDGQGHEDGLVADRAVAADIHPDRVYYPAGDF